MPSGTAMLISSYLTQVERIEQWDGEIPIYQLSNITIGLEANRQYFNHSAWSEGYLQACHRDDSFIQCWRAAIGGSWQDKTVVDVGCGPGNVAAALQSTCGTPRTLIGIDVALGALKRAQKIGYTPVLADAHNIPLKSEIADVVVVNACLHHCDHMAKVLSEAARLVRPGGLLITDHDPQQSAWNYRGLGLWLWNIRLPIYRLIKRGGHASAAEQYWSIQSEIHHRPQDGVTPDLFQTTLEPLGFEIKLYQHSHTAGASVLQGNLGRAPWKCRIAQRLSGIRPDTPESALSLMCIAKKH